MSYPSRTFASGLTRVALRLVIGALFRVRVDGHERLSHQAGAAVVICGLPHRNWVEPVLLHSLLPRGVRVVTVADARTVTASGWRRIASRLVGGVLPVMGGGRRASFDEHLRLARAVLEGGSSLLIFPETGPPARPPSLRRISSGIAHFAAAAQVPVVPVVLGGTEELYLGRRIEIRVLEPIPPPGRERAQVATWMADFNASVQSVADELYGRANSREPKKKRWRWLSGNYPRA